MENKRFKALCVIVCSAILVGMLRVAFGSFPAELVIGAISGVGVLYMGAQSYTDVKTSAK